MYINNIQQKYNNVNYNNSKHVGKILDNSQSEIIPLENQVLAWDRHKNVAG
jgi:protein-arginine kinase activator protein McsA